MQEEIGSDVPQLWPIARILAIFLCLGSVACGQPGINDLLEDPDESLLVPAPREWRQELGRAEQAISRSQFADAVTILGNWLVDQGPLRPAEDYFLESEGGSPRIGLRQRAEQLIGNFPDAGRQLYELQFGADAKRQLQQALTARDLDGLASVVRQYFHTTAGYQATLALGRAELDRGRPVAAIRQFEKLAAQSGQRQQFEPQLSLLLASAWHLVGRPERAAAHLDWLRENLPDAQLVVAGQARPVFGSSGTDPAPLFPLDPQQDQPAYDLEVLESLGHAPLAQSVDQWTMPSGAPSRNVVVTGSMPMASMQWELPIATDQSQREQIQQLTRRLEYQQQSALPVFVPLVVEPWLIMRGLDVIYGVDYSTGRRVWQFPWDGSSLAQEEPSPGQVTDPNELTSRLMHDAVLGQLSSDGQRVFVIVPDRPEEKPIDFQAAMFQAQAFAPEDGLCSRLCALDLAAQGKLVWMVGGIQGGGQPELAQTFFLGTPLAADGKLYCLAERRGELRLVVLSAENGQLLWTQQLLHVGPRALEFNPLRQQVGAVPSLSGGILVCPTTTGLVVAVDIHSRRLLWAHEYPADTGGFRAARSFQLRQQAGFIRAAVLPSLNDRWLDSVAVIAGDRVVVTPADSQHWICLDLMTGKPVGSPRDRGDLLYLAGIRQDAGVFVGTSEITCIDLQSGDQRWSTSLPDSAVVTGRGIMTGAHLYLPTSTPELVQVDLEDGSIVNRTAWQGRLGNLVSAGGLLVSQSTQQVQVFYQRQQLEAEVAERLAADANDPWALLHQGILQREAGRADQALLSLRSALEGLDQQDPHRARIEREMMETLLAAMQNSDQWNSQWWEEARRLPQEPHQQMILQRLLAEHYIRSQQWTQAVSLYLEMVDNWLEDSSADPSTVDRFGRSWTVRRERWLRAGLQDVLEQGDAACRALLEEELDKRLATLLASDVSPEWQRFLTLFPQQPACQPLALRLAEYHRRQGNLILAERYADQVLEYGGAELRAQALVELAQVYGAARRFPLAQQLVEQLRTEGLLESRFEDGRTASEHLELLQKRLAAIEMISPSEWPAGKVEVNKRTTAGNQQIAVRRLVPRDAVRGTVDPDVQLISRQGRGGVMWQILDGQGNTVMQLTNTADLTTGRYEWPRWQTLGHVGLLRVGPEFLAFDWLSPSAATDRVLWTSTQAADLESSSIVRFGPQGSSATRNVWNDVQQTYIYNGIPLNYHDAPSREGVVIPSLGQLRCVDPWTGDTLWERGEIAAGSWLWGDDQVVLVAPPDSQTARVLRRVDGMEVGQCELPDMSRRWAFSGRAILTWDDSDQKRRLRLWDPLLQQERWGLDLAAQTRGCVISAQEVALLEPDGRLRIVDIATGELRADLQVPEGTEHARELRVVRIGRNYAVAGNLDQTSGRRTNRSPFADQFFPCVEVDGWLWLLGPDGQPLWPSLAYVDGYQMPREQPLNVPILVMLRRDSDESRGNGRRRADTVQLACLDRRDGRLLASDPNLGSMVGTMQIAANPADHQASIEFYMGNRTLTYTLQWTDQPRPAEPPAQLGRAQSRLSGNSENRALRVVGSMLDALGTQALRIVDPEGTLDELGQDLQGPLDPEFDDAMEDAFDDNPIFEP